MTTSLVHELARQAKRLSPTEREHLAGELIAGAESASLTEIDEAWVAEAEVRYGAWKAGQTKAVDATKAIREIRGDLRT